MYFILSLFLTGLGGWMLISPRTWYTLSESWKTRDDSEPSDRYEFNIRLRGALFALAGIAYIVISLLELCFFPS